MFLRTFLVVTWDLNGDDTGWGTVTTTKVQALHNEGLNIVDVHDTLFHKKQSFQCGKIKCHIFVDSMNEHAFSDFIDDQ